MYWVESYASGIWLVMGCALTALEAARVAEESADINGMPHRVTKSADDDGAEYEVVATFN